jgi:hypothetical protein
MTNEELLSFTTINADDLEQECQTLPEKFVHIYSLYTEADNAFNSYSESVNAAFASKYLEVRGDLIAQEVKPTENLVDNMVKVDKDLQNMIERKFRLKKQRDFLFGLVQGMNAKRDAVKTLSFLRKEDMRY